MTPSQEKKSQGGEPAFKPFIPAGANLPEFSFLPLLVGAVLGMVFGASSLYLVLKVGLTVSASIPVAVISITLFRLLSKIGVREATILENNIVQTAGSSGESLAFGLGVTMPAILILGFDLELSRVALVAVLGGLLGILLMIPLRRALIVQQHGLLKYPEGTACAEVLKAGATAESLAALSPQDRASLPLASATDTKTIFAGFAIGLLYKSAMTTFKAWKEIPEKIFTSTLKGGSVAAEISPELLGVGYIIGPYLGAIMCGGGVLAYLVLIPAIKFFGEGLTQALPPGTIPIREMAPDDIRGAYVLYIGAGAVAAGGIISLFRSLPTIWHGIKEGLGIGISSSHTGAVLRTDRDLSMKFVFGGIVVLVAAIMMAESLRMNFLGAILIVVFGFLFATVSSRLTGEIGSSSNPISGMTVATLLLTCLIFLLLGWTEAKYYITALSVGGIVCICASNAGTTSQALKTGFLVGATPRSQQIAILIGAFGSALILGPILLRLNDAGSVYVTPVTFDEVKVTNSIPQPLMTTLPAWSPGDKSLAPPKGNSFQLLSVAAPPAAEVAFLNVGVYLINAEGRVCWKFRTNFSSQLQTDVAKLEKTAQLTGVQKESDGKTYKVWQKTNDVAGPAGRYLVDDKGLAVYLVDPGINGIHKTRPDGSVATKFLAPKAMLMSYIIKGILSRELPWGLVLIGVMITLVLEMSLVPSLAFAVGVYLPLSSSSPIFIGGMIRWLVDLYLKKKHKHKNLSAEELTAEGDKSPGVLLASGYIAGGAIAGIATAFLAGFMADTNRRIGEWAETSNPFFSGPNADLLSLIPFVILAVLLYLTGRDILFAAKRQEKTG